MRVDTSLAAYSNIDIECKAGDAKVGRYIASYQTTNEYGILFTPVEFPDTQTL